MLSVPECSRLVKRMSGSEEARGWVLLSRITSRVVLGTISRALPRKPDASLRKGGKHRLQGTALHPCPCRFRLSSGRVLRGGRAVPRWWLASVIFDRRFFVAFLPQRADGEEFIAAGRAAERGNSQDPRNERCLTRDMPYALQVQIAADAAVGKEQPPKGNAAGAKPGFAGCTAPGKNSAHGKQVINDGAAVRTPESGAATGWANEFGLNLRSPERLGPERASAPRKRQNLWGARYNENPKE